MKIRLLALAYFQDGHSRIQMWSWLRQNHLANRSLKGYDNIVDEVCNAWNDFVSTPLRVKSICFRDWMKLIS